MFNNSGLSKWGFLIGLVVVLAFLCLLLGTFSHLFMIGGKEGGIFKLWGKPAFGGMERVNILVLGLDEARKSGRSDTMIVFTVNLKAKRVGGLFVPRDTMVEVPGEGIDKINSAYGHGGVLLAEEVVEELIGVPINYYLVLNVGGFEKIVDILGGVELDVEKRMHYVDRHGGLYINLKPGRQLLDGNQAMQYVRFRHDKQGDIGRIKRQQKFLKALISRQKQFLNLLKMPKVLIELYKNMDTDLAVKDLLAMAELFVDEAVSVDFAMVPGRGANVHGKSYWEVDRYKLNEVVAKWFKGGLRVSVEVLNGSGVNGIAGVVASKLVGEGFEVAKVGNAGRMDCKISQIICYNGKTADGAKIFELLGCGRVVAVNQESAGADIRVIVGRDYGG